MCFIDGPLTAIRGADERRYYLCGHCSLIFADEEHYLPIEQEKAHYETHENSIENSGYVSFLNRLVEPMLPCLNGGMRGLDYGCGPGPTLSLMMKRQGIECGDYDPLFVDRKPQPPYDFITATECFEHFQRPAREMEYIASLLGPGGLLGIMTERWTSTAAFAGWYYTRDPTHVSFYHEKTFEFLCRRFGFSRVWMDDRQVIILRRD
ncbi:MAG: class I SAM-dependent methyltransferase [Gammaproteobacteria bacterium]